MQLSPREILPIPLSEKHKGKANPRKISDPDHARTAASLAFVGGVESFCHAGGEVHRDLFSASPGGCVISDTALLNRLVCDKLQVEAGRLQSSEGWAWVLVTPQCDRAALLRCGRLSPFSRPATADEERDLARLAAEDARLQDELHCALESGGEVVLDPVEQSERSAEIADRRDAIADAISAIKQARFSYRVAELAYAGAMVWLDARGRVRIERGLVRPEDRPALAKAMRDLPGVRKPKAAGRKAHAMSRAVQKSLVTCRDAAAKASLADNPRVAKVLFACSLAGQQLGLTEVAGLMLHGGHPVGVPQSVPALDRIGVALLGGLPKDPVALWGAMVAKTDEELDSILSYGIARQLQLAGADPDMAKLVLEAIAFDVAKHYTPTAENFFGKVPKEFSIAALMECGRHEDADSLGGMTKQQLASLAEREVKGTGWVPAVMRV